MDTKTCSKCGEAKPLDAFAVRRESADGKQVWCRDCVRANRPSIERRREHRRRYAAKNAVETTPDERKKRRAEYAAQHREAVGRAVQYGLSPDEFKSLFAEAGHACALCGRDDKPLVIDHDHACCPERKRSCGKCVRGTLCSTCNTGLGMANDDPALLRRMAAYVENFRRKRSA
jgi:hypothetical protein